MYDRLELVAAINEVLERYQKENEAEGCALCALDALGFTAGQIFSCAPDLESRISGRQHFMAAMDEALQEQYHNSHTLN
jgi:hypothetical protein